MSNIIITDAEKGASNIAEDDKDLQAAKRAAMEADPPRPVAAMLFPNGNLACVDQYRQQIQPFQGNLLEMWARILQADGFRGEVVVATKGVEGRVTKVIVQDDNIALEYQSELSDDAGASS